MSWLRSKLRDAWFGLLRKSLTSDEGRAMLADSLRGIVGPLPQVSWRAADAVADIYPELAPSAEDRPRGSDVIFITARFRSGSTLLWNMFRRLNGFTSYYEPLNERRWFDPARRGERVDASHRNVTDYWREYQGLQRLDVLYRDRWTDRHLLMGADFWDPDLQQYLQSLIAAARGRAVLQHNRIDFRLPWIRRNFPDARLVHLYRHPRDQWCSTLAKQSCPLDIRPAEFAPLDKFYLLNWARDLSHQFPFLSVESAAHPYQLSYYLWRLSYMFGVGYADYSLAFEQLVEDPARELADLFAHLGIDATNLDAVIDLVDRPRQGKWSDYAEDAWFAGHEAACERVLEQFFHGARCPAPVTVPTAVS